MTKTLWMATAAAWWCLVAAAIHSPPAANAQEVAQTNARAVHQTDPQINAQVDTQSDAVATALVDPQINAQVTEHRLTLFHTNDLRGNIYIEEGFDEADLAENQGPENAADRGSLAALVSMIRAHEGTSGVSTLVLDGGNAMGATPACDVDGCRTLIQLMDMAGFDAMVVGGHEFAYGLDTLLTRADQAEFTVLGANLEFGETVDGTDNTVHDTIAPFLLTERSGLQIAVMGLVSSRMADDLSTVDPTALDIQDPRETLESLLAGPAGHADVRIALVNMSMDEARDLALAFPQVQLFIAGGTAAGSEPRPTEHVVRFVDGRYLVTTPGRGTHLGRLEITFRREGGMTAISSLSPVLVPAGSSLLPNLATTTDSSFPLDPAVSAVVARLSVTVREVYDIRIGQTREPIEDTGSWIADLARTRLAADVAAIDRHALRPIRLDGEVRLRTVTRLVRDNDVLVRVSVSGRQLRAWAGRLPREHDVVFAGYDAKSGAVDGQPLNQDRTYVVAVPMILADPALVREAREFRMSRDSGTRIGLRELVTAHVRGNDTLDRWEGIRREPRSVMEGSTRFNGSLTQTTLEGPAEEYSRDPFLSGEESLTWLVRVAHQSTRYTPVGSISAQLRTGYGRLNNNGSQREAVDRIDGEVLYSLPYAQLSQFVGLDVNTVWTGDEGQKHPVVFRFKGGLRTELGSQANVRIGLALERDRITAINVVGVEVAPEFRTSLLPGNSLSSQARVFWGTGQRQTMSVQHFNHLRFRLLDDLAATLDANLFLHRDSDIDRAAVKFELQVGLGYDWRYYR
ncbi:MAG: bifunctional metallophosphatase/5'-nucleotidase [Gemmatimonadetes bacterium]|nr:bifunctional metallophosphatase/5'-nucleotidase [Gemmatimonadota bacterium]MYB60686.1 bifunctional metallophosphatase/5'-nucleotidase [Gemmatimonadota bacterium]